MSGAPECEITKCRPFGVNVPLTRWCGVRACCVRGSPFGLVSVRTTCFSKAEGVAYSGIGIPGLVLHGASVSCCANEREQRQNLRGKPGRQLLVRGNAQ